MTSFFNETTPRGGVRVWDIGVRLFHWSLVAMVVTAYIFDSPRKLHEIFGYAVVILISFRVLWGFIGTRYARFTNFVPGPKRFLSYMRDIAHRRKKRHLGHNPAGGAMIIALLTTLAAIGTTGYMMGLDAYFGEEWLEDLHSALVNFLLILVGFHLLGILTASLRHRENLVVAMITGRKDSNEESNEF